MNGCLDQQGAVFCIVVIDAGQLRVGRCRQIGVIATGNRDVIRDFETVFTETLHDPKRGVVVDRDHCRGSQAFFKDPVHVGIARINIVHTVLSDQIRFERQPVSFQDLLKARNFFKCRQHIHSSPEHCDPGMPEREQMIHEQIHGSHVIDPHHIAVCAVQPACDDGRDRGQCTVDRLHICYICVQFIVASAQENSRIDTLLLQLPEQAFLQFRITQKIVQCDGIVFLSRGLFTGDEHGSIVRIADISHQDTDGAAFGVDQSFCKCIGFEIVFIDDFQDPYFFVLVHARTVC